MNRRVPLKYRNFPGPFEPYAPQVARPTQVWFWVVYLALVVVLAVAGVLAHWPYLPYLAMFGGIAVSVFLLRRWRRRVSRYDWLLCTGCAYPIQHCPPEGRCPECGRAYTHDSTRWGWRVLCGKWSDDMDPPPPLPVRH
ncbi:MAG: hypothetical protein CMJ24_11830 [Phycisphaerae bacterium]|nr:hypothetical protein [Phycisphaerae bacterium]MAB82979.1 hypothetical protein [Phycisphaerae bacterium]MAB84104.1 hypothetical protein [Phycisphaerae bacterium]